MSQIHREHPEATDEEIDQLQIQQLIAGGVPPVDYPTEVRRCRDCQRPFSVRTSIPAGRKWGALCPDCLRWEI